MTSAPLPPNEHQRLLALCRLELLDTNPETAFDAMTSLAANLFDMPIALVSLVDANRQWFKSHYGLDGVTSTGRDIAFCAHAILQQSVFEVRDASADPRFADNPLVTGEPHIRFYAGMPILDRDGMALGTVCVLDHRPRELTPAQREQLRTLGEAVAGLIEMRIRRSELQKYRRAAGKYGKTRSSLRKRRRQLAAFTKSILLVDRLSARAEVIAP